MDVSDAWTELIYKIPEMIEDRRVTLTLELQLTDGLYAEFYIFFELTLKYN